MILFSLQIKRSLFFPLIHGWILLAISYAAYITDTERILTIAPRHSKHSHLRIAICDFDTRVILSLPSQRNHATYAKVNGYTYYRGITSDLDILKGTGRTSHWIRFHYLSKLLLDHDYVLWIDSDAMFVNFSYTIETVLRTHGVIDALGNPGIADIPHQKSLIFAGVSICVLSIICIIMFIFKYYKLLYIQDLCSINTGVLLFRNTHFATQILIPEVWAIGARMLELGLIGDRAMNYDNGAFIMFLSGCTASGSLDEIVNCYNRGCIPETIFHNTKHPIDMSVYNSTIPHHILKHILPVSQSELNCYVPDDSQFIYHFAHGGRRAFKRIAELTIKKQLPTDTEIDSKTQLNIFTKICLIFDPSGAYCEFTL